VQTQPTDITNGGTNYLYILYIEQPVRHIRLRIPYGGAGFFSCVEIAEIEFSLLHPPSPPLSPPLPPLPPPPTRMRSILTTILLFDGYTIEQYASESFIRESNKRIAAALFKESYGLETFDVNASHVVIVAGGRHTCSFSVMREQAMPGWVKQGIDSTAYDLNEFVVPGGCPWGGLATMPGTTTAIAYAGDRLRMHEFGHNFGFNHARFELSPSDYGDWTCTMGHGSEYSPATRHVIGWLPEGTTIQPQELPATFRLGAYTLGTPTGGSGATSLLHSGAVVIAYDDRPRPSSTDGKIGVYTQYGLYRETTIHAQIGLNEVYNINGLTISVKSLDKSGGNAEVVIDNAPSPPPPSPPSPPSQPPSPPRSPLSFAQPPDGTTVSACSTHGNQVLNAIDGNIATSWGCCFQDEPFFFCQEEPFLLCQTNFLLDLQSVHYVDAVRLQAPLFNTFDVFVSSEDNVGTYTLPDEASWQQVQTQPTDITNGGTNYTYLLYIEQPVRHIRLQIPYGGGGFFSCVGIDEIELALSQPPSPPLSPPLTPPPPPSPSPPPSPPPRYLSMSFAQPPDRTTVSACSTHGNQVLNAIDGNIATSWGCCFEDDPFFLSEANFLLDLQSVHYVDAVRLQAPLFNTFDVFVSSEDNYVGTYTLPYEASWQQVQTQPTDITNGGTNYLYILYIEQPVRHIRLRIPYEGAGFFSCVEIAEIELALS